MMRARRLVEELLDLPPERRREVMHHVGVRAGHVRGAAARPPVRSARALGSTARGAGSCEGTTPTASGKGPASSQRSSGAIGVAGAEGGDAAETGDKISSEVRVAEATDPGGEGTNRGGKGVAVDHPVGQRGSKGDLH